MLCAIGVTWAWTLLLLLARFGCAAEEAFFLQSKECIRNAMQIFSFCFLVPMLLKPVNHITFFGSRGARSVCTVRQLHSAHEAGNAGDMCIKGSVGP
jgi:hypothetical protein